MKALLMKKLRLLDKRLFHGPEFASLLRRCGIDPYRYWILVDLFETLGKRQEVARTGSDAYSMRTLVTFWLFFSGVLGVVMGALGAAAGVYLLVFLALTAFQLSMLLIPEIAEGLVNPVEGLILAHQPVNGGHVGSRQADPSHQDRGLRGGRGQRRAVARSPSRAQRRRFPAIGLPHHASSGGSRGRADGRVLCCSLFGWLVRFVPVRRLKAAAAMVQVIPMFIGRVFSS